MGPTPSQPCARRAQPPPCSRHLRDLQAALHDHYAFLPAARGQQLDLGVAAPLLEHLARSRGGRGGGAHPWAVPALNLLPPDVPDPCPFSTPTWPRARLRGWQGCSWPEPEVGVARGSGPGLARAEAEAHLVRAVGAVLVHADALRAALHLSLLAEVGWGQRGHAHREAPLVTTPFPSRTLTQEWGALPTAWRRKRHPRYSSWDPSEPDLKPGPSSQV